MKKILFPLLAAATLCIFWNCAKESLGGDSDLSRERFALDNLIITGDIEKVESTKVSATDDESTQKIQPAWEVGDVVSGYMNNVYANQVSFTVESVTEDGSAKFSVTALPQGVTDIKAGDVFQMFYVPGGVYDPANGTFAIDWSVQDGKLGTTSEVDGVIRKNAYMVAASAIVSDNGVLELKFANKMSVYKITGLKDKDGNEIEGEKELVIKAKAGLTGKGSLAAAGITSMTEGTVKVTYSGEKAYFVLPSGLSINRFQIGYKEGGNIYWWISTATEAKAYSGGTFAGKKADVADYEPLPGRFMISKTSYVQFAPGNLYFSGDRTTGVGEWLMEDEQYDFRTYPNKNSCLNESYSTTGTPANTYGLVGWLNTNPYTNNPMWLPILTIKPGNTFKEWGQFVGDSITWRTLTNVEMDSIKTHYSNKQITISVGGTNIKGWAIFPEGYVSTDKSTYSLDEWNTAEMQGVVFFPGAGYYNYDTHSVTSCTSWSEYWLNSTSGPYQFYYEGVFNIKAPGNPGNCFAVRLVKDVAAQ